MRSGFDRTPPARSKMATRKRLSGAIRSKAISPCKYFRHCTDHIDNMPSHSADGKISPLYFSAHAQDRSSPLQTQGQSSPRQCTQTCDHIESQCERDCRSVAMLSVPTESIATDLQSDRNMIACLCTLTWRGLTLCLKWR